jgi:hypothetical protein
VVAFCFLAAVFTWGLGVFGASVYFHEVTKARGWWVSLVSAGIAVFCLTAALVILDRPLSPTHRESART